MTRFRRFRAIVVAASLLSLPAGVASAHCAHFSCDPSVKYAMGRERMILTLRLGQMTNAIVQMAQETMNKENKIMTKEMLQFLRLRERYAIRTYNIMREGMRVRKILEGVLLSIDIREMMAQDDESRRLYNLMK